MKKIFYILIVFIITFPSCKPDACDCGVAMILGPPQTIQVVSGMDYYTNTHDDDEKEEYERCKSWYNSYEGAHAECIRSGGSIGGAAQKSKRTALEKRSLRTYPYTIVYRQHSINDDGIYENRNISNGRKCIGYHITRSKEEEVEKCTQMNILLYVRFVDEDNIVVKRFYSDAVEYDAGAIGKKLADNDLLHRIYSKTECDEISFKKNLFGTESLKFREVISPGGNTNLKYAQIVNNFELRFVKYSDESSDYRAYLNGFEIDNGGNKHEVVFEYDSWVRLSYEDRLFLENWDEESSWGERRDGRWHYEGQGNW